MTTHTHKKKRMGEFQFAYYNMISPTSPQTICGEKTLLSFIPNLNHLPFVLNILNKIGLNYKIFFYLTHNLLMLTKIANISRAHCIILLLKGLSSI